MKKFYFWSLLLGLTFGSMAFTACGDDDDDPEPVPTPVVTDPWYVGTWESIDNADGVKTQWIMTKTNVTWIYTYLSYDENSNATLVGAGVTGTFELARVIETGQQAFNCHFDHFMNCTNASKFEFKVGDPTGREAQDYVMPFSYDSTTGILTFDSMKSKFKKK